MDDVLSVKNEKIDSHRKGQGARRGKDL